MARYTRTHTHADTDKLPGIVSTDLGQYVFGQAKKQATPAARWLWASFRASALTAFFICLMNSIIYLPWVISLASLPVSLPTSSFPPYYSLSSDLILRARVYLIWYGSRQAVRQAGRKKTAKSAFLINSVQITWRSPRARECGRGRSKNKNGNLINIKAYIIGNWSQIKSVRQHTASLPAASIAATDMVPSAKLINTLHTHTHTRLHGLLYLYKNTIELKKWQCKLWTTN